MIEKDFKDLLVGDVYNLLVTKPAVAKKGSKLREALDALVDRPITRKVYIVDKENKLVGTITIETLLRQVGYRTGARKEGLTSFFKFLGEIFKEDVDDFMNKTPITVTKEDALVDATKLMVENHLNDLPVIDGEGHLVGELNSLEIIKEAKKFFVD